MEAEDRLRYFPADALPAAPAARFAALFEARPRWAAGDITPFLDGMQVGTCDAVIVVHRVRGLLPKFLFAAIHTAPGGTASTPPYWMGPFMLSASRVLRCETITLRTFRAVDNAVVSLRRRRANRKRHCCCAMRAPANPQGRRGPQCTVPGEDRISTAPRDMLSTGSNDGHAASDANAFVNCALRSQLRRLVGMMKQGMSE